MRHVPEPCLCGDPECGRCFPQYGVYEDEDEAYERYRQWEIDEAILEDKRDGEDEERRGD